MPERVARASTTAQRVDVRAKQPNRPDAAGDPRRDAMEICVTHIESMLADMGSSRSRRDGP